MDRKLPNIYANPIQKKLNNTQETYYGGERILKKSSHGGSIPQKIHDIFSSRDFVYKKRVRITTNSGEKECVLVGRTEKSLLTMENETIPISSIIDIEKLSD